jgi:signal transduction histidine kinase
MKTERGLTRKLGRELLLQAVYISLAVIVSVYVAARLMESVLIEQAIEQEADYYWAREAERPGSALPDTKNLTAYRHGMGDGVPANFSDLPPGFHSQDGPRKTLTFVSEHKGERLYLVFETGQVGELVTLFGIIPLALALIVIYLSLYSAYRISRRAVSPIEYLARQVKTINPADPDASVFELVPSKDTDNEIRVLAEALQDLATRVTDFAERERRLTRDGSHELRTPLTVIKIAVDRLLKDEHLDENSEQTLLRIRNSSEDMERLTMAFLLMARETDEGLPKDWVSVNEIVEAEVERLRIIAPEREIAIEVESPVSLLVRAPEKVLESVIGNLLRNAHAYTDDGRITVRIEEHAVMIEDTGPGMAPGDVEKVFQPYYRNQRQRGGFGVGLTIVKRLSDRFHWPIEVDSEVGRGTRVTVRFPAADSRIS